MSKEIANTGYALKGYNKKYKLQKNSVINIRKKSII